MIYIEIKETGKIGIQKGPIVKGVVLIELDGTVTSIPVIDITIIGR